MAMSADFRKHRSIRETIRKQNMASAVLSPQAAEDRARSYSPRDAWLPESQLYADGEASRRCSSQEDLPGHAETSSAPPAVGSQLRLSSPPEPRQPYREAPRCANNGITYADNQEYSPGDIATIEPNLPAKRKNT
ncbi:hypothetical protein LPJ75_006902 [Coemansia sp. RSA 2598]|nr:hypothetical protein LPJ75_006902 [Coemansia sp. RSA 2598]